MAPAHVRRLAHDARPQTPMNSILSFCLGAAACLCCAATFATDRTTVVTPQDPQQMARVKKLTQPGAEHQKLEAFLGSWTTESSFFMNGQKTPAEKGEATFRWQMQGRWMVAETKGSMMRMPYESFWVLGHDNMKKSYVITTVQNMDTAMIRSEGDFLQDGKTLVTYGQMDEYLTGEHDKVVKYVFRFVDADHITIEVHDLHIGEPNTKVLEIAMTKKQ